MAMQITKINPYITYAYNFGIKNETETPPTQPCRQTCTHIHRNVCKKSFYEKLIIHSVWVATVRQYSQINACKSKIKMLAPAYGFRIHSNSIDIDVDILRLPY